MTFANFQLMDIVTFVITMCLSHQKRVKRHGFLWALSRGSALKSPALLCAGKIKEKFKM